MAIPSDGVYRVETCMDTSLIWDLSNESLSNKANLMIYTQNEGVSYAGNHQRYLLKTNGSYKQFFPLHSGKVIEIFGKTSGPANGDNISQYTSNGGANQKWTLTDATSSASGACHVIRSAMNSNYVIDAAYAIAKPGTNVMVNAYNNGDNQKWVLVKDSYYAKTWAVPTKVGMSTSKTGAAASTIQLSGTSGTVYPAWTCSGSRYQVRYRYRGRNKGTDTWSGWALWREPSGSTSNGGWGDPWLTDVTDTTTGTLKHLMSGLSVSLGTAYDKLQYQVEVMKFEPSVTIGSVSSSIPAHGGSATGTINIIKKPTVTISQISFAPDGLRITYSSDFQRGGNAISNLTVKCNGNTLVSGYSTKPVDYTGVIVIPPDMLSFIPDDGTSCAVSFKFATIDTSVTASKTLPITYDASHGLTLSPVFTVSDGYTVKASVTGVTSANCYLQIVQDGNTRFSECEQESTGKFIIVPPFNTEYVVFITASNGTKWGTIASKRPAIAGSQFCVWNSESGWCALALNADITHSAQRDYEAILTNGRPRESVFIGDGFEGNVSVHGEIAYNLGIDHGSVAAFDALQGDGHAVFRAPTGERFDVTVISVEHSMSSSDVRSVSVSMRERS